MRWLPYALAVVGLTVAIVLGSELDFYGQGLGVRHVPSVGAILGMVVGTQLPIMLAHFGPVPKHRMWMMGGFMAFIIPLIEASVKWSLRHDSTFETYLWLGILDVALGALVLALFLPMGKALQGRNRSEEQIAP